MVSGGSDCVDYSCMNIPRGLRLVAFEKTFPPPVVSTTLLPLDDKLSNEAAYFMILCLPVSSSLTLTFGTSLSGYSLRRGENWKFLIGLSGSSAIAVESWGDGRSEQLHYWSNPVSPIKLRSSAILWLLFAISRVSNLFIDPL